MGAHLAGEGRAGFLHLRLDQRVAGFPHQRLSAQFGNTVEQHLTGFDVGDDRGAGVGLQDVAGQQQHQLIAPENAAFAVDRSDPIAVAVEGDAQIASLAAYGVDQLLQVLGDRRVRMVRREGAVDLRVQQDVFARQACRQRHHGVAGGAVAGIPGDLEIARPLEVAQQPVDIGLLQIDGLFAALTGREAAFGGARAERLDLAAEDAARGEHHLEAVVVRRIVRAGHHDAAVGWELADGVVEQGRRPPADARDPHAGGNQSVHQGGLQFRRGQPAIVADGDVAAARLGDLGAEGAAQRHGVFGGEGLSEDAANVVLAEEGRVEAVGRHAALTPLVDSVLVRAASPRPTPRYWKPACCRRSGS